MKKPGKHHILNLKTGKIIDTFIERRSFKESEQDKSKFFTSLSLATDLGFAIAIPLVGGALLGSYLDKQLATTPKVTLSLVFLGLIISGFNIYTIIKKNT